MTYPLITALAAGVLINLQMILMMYTGMGRYKYRQGLGEGDNPDLLSRIRSHGNLAENAPIVLIVLGLLEMAGTSRMMIAMAAALFVFGRLMHPLGLFKTHGASLPRGMGVMTTMLIGMVSGIALFMIALEKLV